MGWNRNRGAAAPELWKVCTVEVVAVVPCWNDGCAEKRGKHPFGPQTVAGPAVYCVSGDGNAWAAAWVAAFQLGSAVRSAQFLHLHTPLTMHPQLQSGIATVFAWAFTGSTGGPQVNEAPQADGDKKQSATNARAHMNELRKRPLIHPP